VPNIDKNDPNVMEFTYSIRFERNANSYRLIHYDTCWENERELEEICIIMEGKDLKGNDLSPYRVINWNALVPGIYDAKVQSIFYRTDPTKPHHQLFKLLFCDKV